MDFVRIVEDASTRFLAALESVPADAPVPCCPDWQAADLLWHLTEVQHFWGTIVAERQMEPDVADLDRPADDALGDLFADRSARLAAALGDADPYDECWSWDEHLGGSVAWVARRQAHEALVHRVDAEATAGWDHQPIDPVIAADGVDECLSVQMSGIPAWAEFVPGGGTVELYCTDADRSFRFEVGRMVGTSLASGQSYDLSVIELRDRLADPSVVIAATAVQLYLWLWGRGGAEGFTVDGDQTLVGTVRSIAAEATG